jgi:hypothetical protein
MPHASALPPARNGRVHVSAHGAAVAATSAAVELPDAGIELARGRSAGDLEGVAGLEDREVAALPGEEAAEGEAGPAAAADLVVPQGIWTFRIGTALLRWAR